MPLTVRISGGAARDLEDMCRYLIRHRSAGRAEGLLDQVEEVLSSLSEFPRRGRYPLELADLGILMSRPVECCAVLAG